MSAVSGPHRLLWKVLRVSNLGGKSRLAAAMRACDLVVQVAIAWLLVETFDKYEFEYTVKTGSTPELSPEHPEISVRRDLASATWRGALRPCQVFVLDFGTRR